MHPTLNHEIARYRQADMHRAAAHARLAHQLSVEADEQPRVRSNLVRTHLTWLRRHPASRVRRPLLGH